jgi:hypothetical protein
MRDRCGIFEFWTGLREDPYYGQEETVTELIAALWDRFFRTPCGEIRGKRWWHPSPQGRLIEILLERGDLKTYWPGAVEPTDWFDSGKDRDDFLKLEIKRIELKRLLREHELPLPMFWFEGEPDDTVVYEHISAKVTGEKLKSVWGSCVRLGEIKDEIADWKALTSDTTRDKLEKEKKLKKLRAELQTRIDQLNGKKPVSKSPRKDDLHRLIEKTIVGLRKELNKDPAPLEIWEALRVHDDKETIQEIKDGVIYWVTSSAKERKTAYKSFLNRIPKIKKAPSTG